MSGLMACGDEDAIVPSEGLDYNYFEVQPDDKSDDAQLRRDFFSTNKSYLFFSDLIYDGPDKVTGEHRAEYLNLNWGYTSYDNDEYTYLTYSDIEEKEAAVDFIQKNIYDRIKGAGYQPYSTFLVRDFYSTDYRGSKTHYTTKANFRTFVISVDKIMSMEDDERQNQISEIIYQLIGKGIPPYYPESTDYNDFFANCNEEYYGGVFISSVIPEWVESDRDETLLYQLGYITYTKHPYGAQYDYFSTSDSGEWRSFLYEVLKYTHQEFVAKFGKYPKVMAKYEVFKKYFDAAGLKF